MRDTIIISLTGRYSWESSCFVEMILSLKTYSFSKFDPFKDTMCDYLDENARALKKAAMRNKSIDLNFFSGIKKGEFHSVKESFNNILEFKYYSDRRVLYTLERSYQNS